MFSLEIVMNELVFVCADVFNESRHLPVTCFWSITSAAAGFHSLDFRSMSTWLVQLFGFIPLIHFNNTHTHTHQLFITASICCERISSTDKLSVFRGDLFDRI